ncbi:MAG TPA: NAD(P)H-dependent oxidoreductase [Candidatus Paceibacterota bacterium]|nr:NAD(P)H-dependent oxidoreductase [Candidatus Paceibacterota bacterium]
MHITILNGTARHDNMSQYVTQAVTNAFSAHPVTVTATSVAEHVTAPVTVPPWGEGGADTVPTAWKELVTATDTFVFVLPEYNHSYPGEWKLLMDSLFKDYAGKRAYVVAVGGGQFAGARVLEHVLPVLVNFQFRIGNERLHIAHASTTVSRDGQVTDSATRERLEQFATAVAAAQPNDS